MLAEAEEVSGVLGPETVEEEFVLFEDGGAEGFAAIIPLFLECREFIQKPLLFFSSKEFD